jgi:hypothetical protein
MDKTIISCSLVVFALFVFGGFMHMSPGYSASAAQSVAYNQSEKDYVTTALRNLADGKFKL